MISNIVFIGLLALLAVSACYYGAGVVLVEYKIDKSPEVEVGKAVFFWAAVILFIILMLMVLPL